MFALVLFVMKLLDVYNKKLLLLTLNNKKIYSHNQMYDQ